MRAVKRRLLDILLILALLAAIVGPFALFEPEILALVENLKTGGLTRTGLGAVFVGLLTLDVFAPVPSSLLGVALGGLFGGWFGAAVCWLGLMSGTLLGYFAGRWAGRPLVRVTVGGRDLDALELLVDRHGFWALALVRAVPVLAEASVILAGAGAYRFARFMAVTGLANLGIAIAYAQVGALGLAAGSMWYALAGAIALPAVAWLLAWPLRRPQRTASQSEAS